MLYIQGMSSCAVQELVNLKDHPDPLSAMVRFCRQAIGLTIPVTALHAPDTGSLEAPDASDPHQRFTNRGSYVYGLGENYIFHGVEHVEGWPSQTGYGYASRFAEFIREHKLGTVVAGDLVANERYHRLNKSRVFVWNPDRAAIYQWWAAHLPDDLKAPKPPVILTGAKVVGHAGNVI